MYLILEIENVTVLFPMKPCFKIDFRPNEIAMIYNHQSYLMKSIVENKEINLLVKQNLTHAVSYIVLLKNLLSTLQVPCQSPTILHSDNQAAIHLAANHIFYEMIKHIKVYMIFAILTVYN